MTRSWFAFAIFACYVLFTTPWAEAVQQDSPRVKQLRGLCDKYVLDYPIKVRRSNEARSYENALVSQLLKELLNDEATKWVHSVTFTGSSIIVSGTYNEGRFSKRSDDAVRKALAEDIQRQTGDLFA